MNQVAECYCSTATFGCRGRLVERCGGAARALAVEPDSQARLFSSRPVYVWHIYCASHARHDWRCHHLHAREKGQLLNRHLVRHIATTTRGRGSSCANWQAATVRGRFPPPGVDVSACAGPRT